MSAIMRSCSRLFEAVTASCVTVRSWRAGDTPKINRLFNDPAIRPDAGAEGSAPRTDAQWMWEFAPQGAVSPAYYVAEKSNRIIGTQGYIPIDLLVDGRQVRSGKDEDTLVHPDHRGRGVLDSLYRRLFDRAVEDDMVALWGLTSTAVRPLLRNGYHAIGRFEAMQAALGAPSEQMPSRAGLDGVSIKSLVQPDDCCDSFSFAFGEYAGGITLHLSSRYLRWRLFNNPHRRHSLIAAYHDELMVGLAAFKLDDPNRIGYVSELAAIPAGAHSAEDILSILLTEGLALFRKRGIRLAEARFSGPHLYNVRVRDVLARWGFHSLPSARASEFLVRPIVGRPEDWLDMKKWRICELMREY